MPPVSPCGHIVDVIRSAYTGQYRFWRDSDLLVPVRWYFVPETRPVLPYATPFSDWAWDNDNTYRPFWIVGTPLQGDDISSRHARNAGRTPNPDPFGLSPHVCGTEAQWAGDMLIGRDLPLRPTDCPCLSPGGLQAVRGGGVGGGWAAIGLAPRELAGRGSGVGGGVADLSLPLCGRLPASADVYALDVSTIGSGTDALPTWPGTLSLTRDGVNPCLWLTPYYDWVSGGSSSVANMRAGFGSLLAGVVRLDFRRTNDGAVVATYLVTGSSWDGGSPITLPLLSSTAELTWPATLTVG